MSLDSQRKTAAILRILDEADRPLGSTKIARALRAAGIDLKQRMVRNYLEAADEAGLTVNLGRRGRRITERGRDELSRAVVIDHVGFVDARADELAYKMSLDLPRRAGTVILNVSTVAATQLADARRIAEEVVQAGYGMGVYGTVAAAGETLAGFRVPEGEAALGTVCAITLNGLLYREGIPVEAKFGGLLECRQGEPVRFTHAIHYAGTTLDPLEVFIKAGMTNVLGVVRDGDGVVGASFREIPAAALPRAERLIEQVQRAGLAGLVRVGDPNRPLMEIPVGQGRAGIVVTAGLNALAAVQEAGIPTKNQALARLCDLAALEPLVPPERGPRP